MTCSKLMTSVLTALALAMPLTLAGCSSGSDGAYVADNTSSIKLLDQLEIKGDTVTYTQLQCDGTLDDEDTSVGQLDKSKTAIVWVQEGYYKGTSTATFADGVVSIDGEQKFVRPDSDQGKFLQAEHKDSCS